MEVSMQPARQAMIDRGRAGQPRHVPPVNRTLMWFGDDAEQRRRAATAAQEAPVFRAVTDPSGSGFRHMSYAEIRRRAHARRAAYLRAACRRFAALLTAMTTHIRAPALRRSASGTSARRATVWQRREVFGCVALAALAVAMVEVPPGLRPCRTEPAVLRSATDVEATMTVARGGACAIWTRAENISVDDLSIEVAPQHGNLALRGRTGVTYRPARTFTGDDFFAYTLHGRSDAQDASSVVRVRVSVK
jgi:hypothetical protein